MSSADAPTLPRLPFSEVAPASRCRALRSSATRFFLFPEIHQPGIPPHAQSHRQARKAIRHAPSLFLHLEPPVLLFAWPAACPAPSSFRGISQSPIQFDSPPREAQQLTPSPDCPHPRLRY